MTETREIWVFAEHRGGRLARVTLELLGKAQELAQAIAADVAAVAVGSGVGGITGELAAYGTRRIYVFDDARLELYQAEAYASLVAGLIRERRPEIFLLGSTDTGKDLAPRIAAKVGTGLTAHCVDLKIREHCGVLVLCQVVPGWGGAQTFSILCPERRPQMATVKAGLFDVPTRREGNQAEVIRVPVHLDDRLFRAETLEVAEQAEARPIEEAETVIGAGWGAYSLGDLKMVEELAGVLDAAVGGTRPLVDKGWIPAEHMIGQSGKIVSPRLFISLGASGAMHFTTGFQRAKLVLAVDQNPDAAIFNSADIGIVGDLRKVLSLLIEGLRQQRNEQV